MYTLQKKLDAYYLYENNYLIASTSKINEVYKLKFSEIEELLNNTFAIKKANVYANENSKFKEHYLKGFLDCQSENIHKEYSLWDMLKMAEVIWDGRLNTLGEFKAYLEFNYTKQSEWVVDIALKPLKDTFIPDIKNGFITIKKIK
jgi:hypothetical protein